MRDERDDGGERVKQQTLAMAADQASEFALYRRPTKRDVFLQTMNEIVPWEQLCEVIRPHYPKGEGGRPPKGLERMLRMYFVQHWFNLADEACEEALLDSTSLRRFVGIDLGRERVPDGTTLLKFRHLLEEHELGKQLFAKVGEVLQAVVVRAGEQRESRAGADRADGLQDRAGARKPRRERGLVRDHRRDRDGASARAR